MVSRAAVVSSPLLRVLCATTIVLTSLMWSSEEVHHTEKCSSISVSHFSPGDLPQGRYGRETIDATRTAVVVFVTAANITLTEDMEPFVVIQDGVSYSGRVPKSELHPLEGLTVTSQQYTDWPSNYTCSSTNCFFGGVVGGDYVWLIPYAGTQLVRVHRHTGVMTGFGDWPSGITATASQKLGEGCTPGVGSKCIQLTQNHRAHVLPENSLNLWSERIIKHVFVLLVLGLVFLSTLTTNKVQKL